MLKSQIDSLSAEVESLKAEQAKAQELQRLHDEHLAKVDAREKSLQNRLHEAIEALRGKLVPMHHVLMCMFLLQNLIEHVMLQLPRSSTPEAA
jgi:ABC-type phosphate transport system auxiliary subunit